MRLSSLVTLKRQGGDKKMEDDFIVDMKKKKSKERLQALKKGLGGVASRVGTGFKRTGQFFQKTAKDMETNRVLARQNKIKNLKAAITEAHLEKKLRAVRGNRPSSDDFFNFSGFDMMGGQKPKPMMQPKAKKKSPKKIGKNFIVQGGRVYKVV